MRGDRPCCLNSRAESYLATPHARGSTRTWHTLEYDAQGYPACAGIDLSLALKRAAKTRLPRMRGDRPIQPFPGFAVALATPHARGSTPCSLAWSLLPLGYPACAGIDLVADLIPCKRTGLPRMRGDRPHLLYCFWIPA